MRTSQLSVTCQVFCLTDAASMSCDAWPRVTARPWKADEFLNNVATQFVWKRHSITNLVQHSHMFKVWFEENAAAVKARSDTDPAVKTIFRDLQLAKQRFDSTQKPMGRFVLNFEALVLTAAQVATRRAGKPEGFAAEEFLVYSSNLEHLVQMAMLADAGDEGMLFTRFCDSENMDVSMISEEVSTFLARITALFVQGKAPQLGYTQLMLQTVRTVKLVVLRHRALTIGCRDGAPAEIVRRCLCRMAGWVALAAKVISTEFPSFELLQSFAVFNLGDGADDPAALVAARPHLLRMAAAFGVDGTELFTQWEDHRALARRHFLLEGCTFLESWRRAMERTQLRWNKDRHPATALLPVLQRYAAYRGSTSGVEQNFAVALRCCNAQRQGALSGQSDLDSLTLAVDASTPERAETLDMARRVWCRFYGAPRRRSLPGRLMTKAEPGGNGPGGLTEAAWLRQRRAAVAEVTPTLHFNTEALANVAASCAAEAWTARHDKERALQEARLELRRAEEVPWLLPGEEGRHTAGTAVAVQTARQANFLKRATVEKTVQAVFKRPASGLAGRLVHVATELHIPGNLWMKLRARVCKDPLRADTFCVADPVNCGVLRTLAAALIGGCICTPEFVTSNGEHGCSLVYQRAVDVPRFVWVSGRFRRRHVQAVQVIMSAVASHGSKWKVIRACSEFLRRSKANQSRAMALVTPEDKLVGREAVHTPKQHIYRMWSSTGPPGPSREL